MIGPEVCENCRTVVEFVEWPEPMLVQVAPASVVRDAWVGPVTVEHTPELCRTVRAGAEDSPHA